MAIKHDSGLSTRDEILRLTVEAIDQGGEGGVHVAEIAKASHVAVTSIYHFFRIAKDSLRQHKHHGLRVNSPLMPMHFQMK